MSTDLHHVKPICVNNAGSGATPVIHIVPSAEVDAATQEKLQAKDTRLLTDLKCAAHSRGGGTSAGGSGDGSGGSSCGGLDTDSPGVRKHHMHHMPRPSSSLSANFGGGCGGSDVHRGFSEESQLLSSLFLLSRAIGLRCSFSMSDICSINSLGETTTRRMTRSKSESALEETLLGSLEGTARSLSTWVAMGDASITSQLPSPQACSGQTSLINPMEIVKAVSNRKRVAFLRRKMALAFKTMDKFHQLNIHIPSLPCVEERNRSLAKFSEILMIDSSKRKGQNAAASAGPAGGVDAAEATPPGAVGDTNKALAGAPGSAGSHVASLQHVVQRDVDRDRGKPLSVYERNMIVFDWLYQLNMSN